MKFVAFALAFAVLDYFYVFFYIMNDHSLLLAYKATRPLAPAWHHVYLVTQCS